MTDGEVYVHELHYNTITLCTNTTQVHAFSGVMVSNHQSQYTGPDCDYNLHLKHFDIHPKNCIKPRYNTRLYISNKI
jgi:hypothetical protein